MKKTEYDALIQQIVEDNKKLNMKNIKSIYINKWGRTGEEKLFKVGQTTNLKDAFGRNICIHQIKVHIECNPKYSEYACIRFRIYIKGKEDEYNYNTVYECVSVETCCIELVDRIHLGLISEDDSKLILCYRTKYNPKSV